MTEKRFQVALSFAGENRAYVEQVANFLAKELGQEKVFYDAWYEPELARFDLDVYLGKIYHDHSELIVAFLCADYENKDWCGVECYVIRDLLKKRKYENIMFARFDNAEISGLYSNSGYLDLQKRTPEQTAADILKRLGFQSKPKTASPKIHLNRLPDTKGQFFGRHDELNLLDNALTDNKTAIIQFIAAGGTGKTKLLQHWLAQHKDGALLAWSFYSQGSSEDKQVSASPFFEALFDKLHAERRQFACDDDKGEYLAELLCRQPCVLVLDGLEPLQHAGKGMRGELKDKAIRALLRHLLGQNSGNKVLCVITSRLGVQDFDGRDGVVTHDLHQLDTASGKALLQALGVLGKDSELAKAVQEYGNHAFSLYLLGNTLTYWLDGDICRRDQIGELLDDSGELRGSPHAFKMMQAYERWFAGQTELTVLWLLGLFDHPIEKAVLRQLQQAQIEGLTAGLDEREFNRAVQSLIRDHHLLFSHEAKQDTVRGEPVEPPFDKLRVNGDELLDCHPLIREFFGKRLQQHNPAAWQAAHERLYHYYKSLPKKHQPDTLAEMQPLFHAVSHGCAAGLYQQAHDEVYLQRIRRNNEFYLTKKLGAFSDDLAVLAHFFSQTWQTPAPVLSEAAQAVALNIAGFDLRALGRLREAVQPMQAGLKIQADKKDWKQAASAAGNLSELLLSLGDIAAAITQAQASVDYADRSEDLFQRMARRTTHADALAQSADSAGALALFQAAEQIQQQHQSGYPLLYSLRGFQYGELLLSRGEAAEVLRRAEQTLVWMTKAEWLLDIALDQLNIARAHQKLAQQTADNSHCQIADEFFELAIAGLRKFGHQELLTRGLLARANFYREQGEWEKCEKDLAEVWEIASYSGMRLFLCDYHLEMARLALAELRTGSASSTASPEAAIEHYQHAKQLIEDTGYHRRDAELDLLAAEICRSSDLNLDSKNADYYLDKAKRRIDETESFGLMPYWEKLSESGFAGLNN